MIAKLIRWSIDNRVLVVITALMVAALGVYSVKETSVDALPDLSDVQVIIKTTSVACQTDRFLFVCDVDFCIAIALKALFPRFRIFDCIFIYMLAARSRCSVGMIRISTHAVSSQSCQESSQFCSVAICAFTFQDFF